MNWHFNNKVPVATPVLVRINTEKGFYENGYYWDGIPFYYIVQKENEKDDYITELSGEQYASWPLEWVTGWISCEDLERDWNNIISS